MKKVILLVLSVFFSLSFSGLAGANKFKLRADETKKLSESEVLKIIAQKYERLGNWQASFSQETESIGLGAGGFSLGEFFYVAPNKFKYSLHGQSEFSDFVSNGKQAWYFRFREGRKKPPHVVHFKTLKNVDIDKYLFLLKGFRSDEKSLKKLKSDFKLKASNKGNVLELHLEPKEDSEISSIDLYYDKNKDTLQSAKLEYATGDVTKIKVSDYKKANATGTKQLFSPSIPKGAKVEVRP